MRIGEQNPPVNHEPLCEPLCAMHRHALRHRYDAGSRLYALSGSMGMGNVPKVEMGKFPHAGGEKGSGGEAARPVTPWE